MRCVEYPPPLHTRHHHHGSMWPGAGEVGLCQLPRPGSPSSEDLEHVAVHQAEPGGYKTGRHSQHTVT